MDRERRRLATMLVAITGVLLTHGGAYVLAHPVAIDRRAALDGHAYLSVVGTLAVPLAAAALGWAAVRAARSTGAVAELSVARLALWQTAGFVAQEVGERIVVGDAGGVLHEPAIAIGLLLQLPVAALLVGLVRAGRRAMVTGVAAPDGRAHRRVLVAVGVGPSPSFVTAPVPLSPLSRRGPPRRRSTD